MFPLWRPLKPFETINLLWRRTHLGDFLKETSEQHFFECLIDRNNDYRKKQMHFGDIILLSFSWHKIHRQKALEKNILKAFSLTSNFWIVCFCVRRKEILQNLYLHKKVVLWKFCKCSNVLKVESGILQISLWAGIPWQLPNNSNEGLICRIPG